MYSVVSSSGSGPGLRDLLRGLAGELGHAVSSPVTGTSEDFSRGSESAEFCACLSSTGWRSKYSSIFFNSAFTLGRRLMKQRKGLLNVFTSRPHRNSSLSMSIFKRRLIAGDWMRTCWIQDSRADNGSCSTSSVSCFSPLLPRFFLS